MTTTSTRHRAMALSSAIVVPSTTAAKDKHLSKGGSHTGDDFAPAALYPPLTSTLLRLAEDESLQLEQVDCKTV
ncbi:hypothetical protein [Paraburkholderia tagetis]|uniref:Uncharacterized protein n=1 Tax=Paraburkholderia tagetis TaxID=2913261 RepID=A0A9X1RQ89_9BURK|nr:hypothetical protein [Paraburkholderia tagetis]MCG5076336.1 hypothetical protein [Paraburkholderia tagetis]